LRSFHDILRSADNPLGAAIVLVLSWLATYDGTATDEEIAGLRAIASAGKNEAELTTVIEIARRGDVRDLQLACEVLRHIDPAGRRLFLQMAIGMALEDDYLVPSESHIVRFVADLLGIWPRDLDEIFTEMTGHPFPPPSDPSSVDWWNARQRRRPKSNGAPGHANESSRTHNASARSPDMSRLRDLAMLGLDENASASEIREAYRRMAKVHHPDAFSSLGPEAVRAATVSFRRVQAAYERLIPT
jgi:DnaJ like chaperone protein